jgi:hypothetical protein
VPPYGDVFARSTSTWIHWKSPVASAELVDALLIYRDPVGHADLFTDGGAHLARFFEADGFFHLSAP